MDTILCRSVTKNLTAYRVISAEWGLDDMKAEIHSFPTMYIMWGGKWGRNENIILKAYWGPKIDIKSLSQG